MLDDVRTTDAITLKCEPPIFECDITNCYYNKIKEGKYLCARTDIIDMIVDDGDCEKYDFLCGYLDNKGTNCFNV